MRDSRRIAIKSDSMAWVGVRPLTFPMIHPAHINYLLHSDILPVGSNGNSQDFSKKATKASQKTFEFRTAV